MIGSCRCGHGTATHPGNGLGAWPCEVMDCACMNYLHFAVPQVPGANPEPVTFTQAELETIVEAAVLTERRAVVAWLEGVDPHIGADIAKGVHRG